MLLPQGILNDNTKHPKPKFEVRIKEKKCAVFLSAFGSAYTKSHNRVNGVRYVRMEFMRIKLLE